MKRLLAFALVLVASQVWAAHTYVPKRSWVQLAAITYQDAIPPAGFSGDGTVMYSKVGYYDMLLNAGGTLKTTFRSQNPGGAIIAYNKASSIYSPQSVFNQLPSVAAWSATQGDIAPWDILLRPTATVVMTTKAYNGTIYNTTTTAGNYLEYFFWNDYRYALNFFEPKVLGWYAYNFRNAIGSDNDGIMEDEALGGQNGQGYVAMPGSFPIPQTGDNRLSSGTYSDLGYPFSTYRPMADSATRFLLNDFYQKWSDTLYNNNWMHFKNYAAYLYATDTANYYDPGASANPAWAAHNSPNDQWNQAFVNHRNINFLLGEYSSLILGNNTRHWQYMNYMQTLVDSGCKAVLWCGPQYNAFLNQYDYDIATYGKQRAFRNMYCYYLMSQHPTRTWWLVTTNQAETRMFPCDTIMQRGLTEYNIGQPVGHFIDSTNTLPFHYTIRTKRYYTNAVVLYQNLGNAAWNYNLAADTARFHCTGFYTLQDNGSLSGSAVLSTSLASGPDGQIMIPNTAQGTQFISISNANAVTEGQQLAFQVTRTWTDSPVTIFYNTVNGTAVAPEDYVAELSGQLTIPTGFASGTIFILTNTDALLEPTQNMSVHLSSSSDGSITTADASGSILDGTTPPSPSNEKKLKLKKI